MNSSRNEIQTLTRYHAWANNRLMRKAANLNTEQLQTACWLSQGNILHSLVHLLDVQWSWLQICKTSRMPIRYITTADFGDIRQFRQAWQAEDQALMDYADGLSQEQLQGIVTYSWPQARPRSKPLWHILLHIINHGTHHRAEIGQYLASLGRSPGDMDLIKFLATEKGSSGISRDPEEA